MSGKRKQREKDLTSRYLSGDMDEDALQTQQRFSARSANFQQRKMERTALLRAAEEEAAADIGSLPTGLVVQVYSLYYDVECEGIIRLCVLRKTLSKLLESPLVVGDAVRFRETGGRDETGRPEAVIEQVLPRRTILTRADSFKAMEQQPIVANADQVLIVVSLHEPDVKWGLVDRMITAARSGGLSPSVCLNKLDLARPNQLGIDPDLELAGRVLEHYRSLGISTLSTSVPANNGLDDLRAILSGRTTVVAGHSGVGKSTLLNAIQPTLNLRTGVISGYTGKGRHTTTSARRYPLEAGGYVIDTPGVKLFGLWGVTRENLIGFFPDVADDSAPQWRRESYERIMQSLPG